MNTFRTAPIAISLALTIGATGASQAAIVSFNANPFANSAVTLNDGIRQITAVNQIQLASFDVANDAFAFNRDVFGLGSSLTFVNALASALPAGGADVIVLQNGNDPANPTAAFGAAAAANLIAAALDDGIALDGFFVYFNSVLGVNRLVYSTNLSVNTADLSILARINSPTGSNAISALPTLRAENFAAVPEPSSYALALAALMGVAVVSRRPKKIAA